MKTLLKLPYLKSFIGSVLSLALAMSAVAANVHYKVDPVVEETEDGGLEACFSLAGLGNKDIVVDLVVAGTATVTIINPGSNQPPGQNKVPVRSANSIAIPKSAIKNGNVDVCIGVDAPVINITPPNPNWTVETDIVLESATITVTQGGKVVLTTTIDLT